MTTPDIMAELEAMAQPGIRNILLNHGGPSTGLLGVKVEDLKTVMKKVKKSGAQPHQLALELYDTGVSDAMYLAGLMADVKAMTKEDLQRWVRASTWHMISEYTVPWVAAESTFGLELGLEWMNSPEEQIAAAGWTTLGCLVALIPDDKLDLPLYGALLQEVETKIHQAPNRVRYTMNNFVIAVGGYVAPLHRQALEAAEAIGKVTVYMGDTACKVPSAYEYIQKMVDRGMPGKKKKTVRC